MTDIQIRYARLRRVQNLCGRLLMLNDVGSERSDYVALCLSIRPQTGGPTGAREPINMDLIMDDGHAGLLITDIEELDALLDGSVIIRRFERRGVIARLV